MNPSQAWQLAIDGLQQKVTRAEFTTWLRSTALLDWQADGFRAGTVNAFARDWLQAHVADRLAADLSRMMGRPQTVQFVIANPQYNETVLQPPPQNDRPAQPDFNLEIAIQRTGAYERIVKPDAIITFPRYLLRHVRRMGARMFWLYLGFRQAALLQDEQEEHGFLRLSPALISRYSAIAEPDLRAYLRNPATWKLLAGFISPENTTPGSSPSGRNGEAADCTCQVSMSIPLTPADALSLRNWLAIKQAHVGLQAAIEAALNRPVDDLVPWAANLNDLSQAGPHVTVDELIKSLGGEEEHAVRLQAHLMPVADSVILTRYFIKTWLPRLGPERAMLVVWLRERCSAARGAAENWFTTSHSEIQAWLGIDHEQTLLEVLQEPELRAFVREVDTDGGSDITSADHLRPDVLRRYWVTTHEPLIPDAVSGLEEGTHIRAGEAAQDARRTPFGHHPGGMATRNHGQGLAQERETRTLIAHEAGNGGVDFLSTGAQGCIASSNPDHTEKPEEEVEDQQTSNQEVQTLPDWDLNALLEKNRVAPRKRQLILQQETSASPFISWLLYGAAHPAVENPVSLAISKLTHAPGVGAGGLYDQLASLTTAQLSQLLKGTSSAEVYYLLPERVYKLWKAAMGKVEPERFMLLASQLLD